MLTSKDDKTEQIVESEKKDEREKKDSNGLNVYGFEFGDRESSEVLEQEGQLETAMKSIWRKIP